MNQVATLQRPSRAEKTPSPGFKVFTERHLDQIPHLQRLNADSRRDMAAVAAVLPFRVNNYVIEELIDWDDVPNDPIFQLTFPQPGMLKPEHLAKMRGLVDAGADKATLRVAANAIRMELNPHPAGQLNMNIPSLGGEALEGVQHKYHQTVLFFPAQGQTCHAYCSFCFRWAQFIGDKELRFSATEGERLLGYLEAHPEVSDLLITGGDPMVMKTRFLEAYLEPLLRPEFDHVRNIRIGTKALGFWPHRFVHDEDADDLMRLFERLVKAGKHLAFMAHFSHGRELETPVVQQAIRRIQASGAIIRSQSPVIAHVNDSAEEWADMWTRQTQMGIVPYYMFVERDTGAQHYFEVPLEKTWHIYRDAIQRVSGLSRTARGPSMSAAPGKVEIQGVSEIAGEKVFVLRFIQGRQADWVQRPFFAQYDPEATWFDDLKPAFGESRFFFEAD